VKDPVSLAKDIASKAITLKDKAVGSALDGVGKIPIVGGTVKAIVDKLGQILCPKAKINVYSFLMRGLPAPLAWAVKTVELILKPLFNLLNFPKLLELPGLDFLDVLNPPSFSFNFDLDFLGADIFEKIKAPVLAIDGIWSSVSTKIDGIKKDTCHTLLQKRLSIYDKLGDSDAAKAAHEQVSGWKLDVPVYRRFGKLPGIPTATVSSATPAVAPVIKTPPYNPKAPAPAVENVLVGGRAPTAVPVTPVPSPPSGKYYKVFDGECDGKEIRMFNGNGDNDGSSAARAALCAQACQVKARPVAGSWTGFKARGFIVVPTTGRCYCESADSRTCARTNNSYDRYDWGSAPTQRRRRRGSWNSRRRRWG